MPKGFFTPAIVLDQDFKALVFPVQTFDRFFVFGKQVQNMQQTYWDDSHNCLLDQGTSKFKGGLDCFLALELILVN